MVEARFGRSLAITAALVLGLPSWSSDARADDAPPASGRQPPQAGSAHKGSAARTVGWISVAIGAEAAVVAVATSFMLLHQKSVRDDHCDAAKICSTQGLDANATIRTLTGWNAGAWAVAAAGLGVGAVLVLTHPAASSPRTAVVVSPSAAGLSLTLRGEF